MTQQWTKYSAKWLLLSARHLLCADAMTVFIGLSRRHSSFVTDLKDVNDLILRLVAQ